MDSAVISDLKSYISTTVETAINGLGGTLRQEMTEMKNTLHHEITSLDSRVSERFNQQETRINTRFDEQETKINARFDKQETQINARFDQIYARFDDNDTILNEVLNVVQEAQGKAIRLHADHIDNHERRITKLEK